MGGSDLGVAASLWSLSFPHVSGKGLCGWSELPQGPKYLSSCRSPCQLPAELDAMNLLYRSSHSSAGLPPESPISITKQDPSISVDSVSGEALQSWLCGARKRGESKPRGAPILGRIFGWGVLPGWSRFSTAEPLYGAHCTPPQLRLLPWSPT